MLGLKVSGVKGRSSWGRMLASNAMSVALMAGIVNSLKYSAQVERPDGTDLRSFPSGHTATAFMTATMLNKEYGYRESVDRCRRLHSGSCDRFNAYGKQ